MVSKIFMISKTGRGAYITPFGMGRKALHRTKRGKGASILLSDGLTASDGGVGGTGIKNGGQIPLHQEKPIIENIQRRLENLSVKGGKRKNVRFQI